MHKGLEPPDLGVCRGPGISPLGTPRDDCIHSIASDGMYGAISNLTNGLSSKNTLSPTTFLGSRCKVSLILSCARVTPAAAFHATRVTRLTDVRLRNCASLFTTVSRLCSETSLNLCAKNSNSPEQRTFGEQLPKWVFRSSAVHFKEVSL